MIQVSHRLRNACIYITGTCLLIFRVPRESVQWLRQTQSDHGVNSEKREPNVQVSLRYMLFILTFWRKWELIQSPHRRCQRLKFFSESNNFNTTKYIQLLLCIHTHWHPVSLYVKAYNSKCVILRVMPLRLVRSFSDKAFIILSGTEKS